MTIRVRDMAEEDWPAVAAIYAEGINGGNATLEMTVPSLADWSAGHLPAPRLVAVDTSSAVVGWAALAGISNRCVYEGVAEVSVYVASTARGAGVGRTLLDALVVGSEQAGVWMLQAQILAENTASIRLHERCGFTVLGVRERLGRRAGVWRDVVHLDRRSAVVGC